MSRPLALSRPDAGEPSKLVRLVYLDEAGTAATATEIVVAGVIVHGDDQWRDVDRRIVALIDEYIPEEDRIGFVFHATDVFHGGRYFDRRNPRWASREQRWPILEDLAQIITDFELPVVLGARAKVVADWDEDQGRVERQLHPDVLHLYSAIECLGSADLWLNAFAPDEFATVVHEDGPSAKPVIRRAVRALRHPETLDPEDRHYFERAFGLPFDHIIDTVHFAEKGDARFLQLADLCAFIISRAIDGRSVPPSVLTTVLERASWMTQFKAVTSGAFVALLGERGPRG